VPQKAIKKPHNEKMVVYSQDHSLFFRFIEKFSPTGFKGIDRNDPLIQELEEMMEINNQFLYIADTIHMKIMFTSKRSMDMIGINPEELTFYHFMEATHPKDIQRLNLGRATLLKKSQELYIAEEGNLLLSSSMKIRNTTGEYSNVLLQNYLFYTTDPYKTVFLLKIHTNIDWFKNIKNGYHYYIGNDLSFFRFPDRKMLLKGNVFSDREFEILKLIESGLSSEQIANKIFVSTNTVNTHRRNILQKTGKLHISELIYELIERGVL
jgi:DNA-binding CsgD family transcriptional regulator